MSLIWHDIVHAARNFRVGMGKQISVCAPLRAPLRGKSVQPALVWHLSDLLKERDNTLLIVVIGELSQWYNG